ncbi:MULTISPECIES: amino acid ABC transporter permease [unclassified Lentilitoribacter]|jgi:general L-amino acid transport system permease protein|uniref:amino acid ABC transporter permease n=1 Tax=unclassified Lentilitoribacter TaxID=2647570 RepID=UPI0013A69CC2|nr:amino acid ABC transporter permease [Lentilitoribacter sp. Alg239-R112]
MFKTVPGEFEFQPPRPAPIANAGPIGWMRENLFSSPLNIILTLIGVYIIWSTIPPLLNWAIFEASWAWGDRTLCEEAAGACWTYVRVRFSQIIYGPFYGQNESEIWRPLVVFALFAGIVFWLIYPKTPYKGRVAIASLILLPVASVLLIHGGLLGLKVAPTSQWGGFMLTLILAVTGIIGALPIGIIMALGRQSDLPIFKALSVVFIEFWRGAPLVTVLFMASVIFPLFFPAEMDFDKVVRALVAITLFQSAYTAEAIRGGLASLPRGQAEAADALGLGYWQKTFLIILPQALKVSIPSIVNTFIALFKDTSLVYIIGLLDLLDMARSTANSLEWRGVSNITAYVFAAMIFFMFTSAMSAYSRGLERKLDTEHKS